MQAQQVMALVPSERPLATRLPRERAQEILAGMPRQLARQPAHQTAASHRRQTPRHHRREPDRYPMALGQPMRQGPSKPQRRHSHPQAEKPVPGQRRQTLLRSSPSGLWKPRRPSFSMQTPMAAGKQTHASGSTARKEPCRSPTPRSTSREEPRPSLTPNSPFAEMLVDQARVWGQLARSVPSQAPQRVRQKPPARTTAPLETAPRIGEQRHLLP